MGKKATRGIPFRDWPEVDRILWDRLTQPAGPFDVDGPLSHMRPASLESLRNAYGFFLKHAWIAGLDLQHRDPADRASLEMLRSYFASLGGLSLRTQAGYFNALSKVLRSGYPTRDWSHLHAACRSLLRRAERAGTSRAAAAVPSSVDFVRLARQLASDADRCVDPLLRVEAMRDSLMLQFLANHPIRLKNFAELELGRSILRQGDRFAVSLPGAEMKSHRPLFFTLSNELSARVEGYIADARAAFPGGETRSSGRLWLRFTYGAWEKAAIGRHISRLTERGLGKRVTPHMFRHAAATTIAEGEGADVQLIGPLLGHPTDETATRHYILAGSLSASQQHQKALREILKRGRTREHRK